MPIERWCVCCGKPAESTVSGQDSDGHVWIYATCRECELAIEEQVNAQA